MKVLFFEISKIGFKLYLIFLFDIKLNSIFGKLFLSDIKQSSISI